MVAAVFAIALSQAAFSQEISGPCSQAVGTFLTTNRLGDNDKGATSRSILVLTNGGHVLRFDSDEAMATTDRRAFGDSAGTWRCDRVESDGAVRITAVMFDFTYPGPQGQKGQIVRIDTSGRYVPAAATLELTGRLGFLPIDAEARQAAAMAMGSDSIAISLRGAKVTLPAPAR